jgi:polyisoprenoid-binding protein YceI
MQGTIKVASIDTVHAKRHKHVRSADFFDGAQYPEITLPFTITKPITHKGKTRLRFEARVEIDRQDYVIAYNKPQMSAASWLVTR